MPARIGCLLGHRHVSGLLDEPPELSDGDRPGIDPEPVDGSRAHWPFLRIKVGRSHPDLAARYPGHPCGRHLTERTAGCCIAAAHRLPGPLACTVISMPVVLLAGR